MKYYRIIFGALLFIFGMSTFVSASTTLGTIDPNNSGNYKALVENSALGAATGINFGKFTTQSGSNITVSNTELRGFAWGEGLGWFVTNCADTTSNCSNPFKVANDGTGLLSGYAWGENTGWINFGPFSNSAVSRVKINNGLFGGTLGAAGYAWSQNFGWLTFDCSNAASCVETDWRPSTPVVPPPGGGSTGGGQTDVCKNPGIQLVVPPGQVLDTAGYCVPDPGFCANTVNYDDVPLLTSGSSGSVTVSATNASTIGFAIKAFNRYSSQLLGIYATENALNAKAYDHVVAYTPSSGVYALGFEDVANGDSDYQDFVAQVSLSCDPNSAGCPTPSSLTDSTVELVKSAPPIEKNLQTILDNAGYGLNVIANQKQYQSWSVPSNTSVTIQAKNVAGFAGNVFVFGYYKDGQMSTFIPLFKTANVVGHENPVPVLCIPNPSDFCPNISGIQTEMPAGKNLNTAGQCVDILPYACPNFPQSMATIPDGFMYDTEGNCVPLVTPPVPPTVFCTTNPSDPSCVPPVAPTSYQCSDGIDNDKDGYIDYPSDPGCSYAQDDSEANPSASFCKTHPNDASCVETPYCYRFPDAPRCLNPNFCEQNPGDPSCVSNPQNPSFCVINPTDPSCMSDRDVCPNIEGIQQVQPKGMMYDSQGKCVPRDIKIIEGTGTGQPTTPLFGGLFSIPHMPYSVSLQLAEIITAFGVILPIASTTTSFLISHPLAFSDIPLLIARGWSSFLTAIGWRKRKKPWGTVYDSVTKLPIDPAYVVLTDIFGNEIATSITDINGRYGFAVDPGRYKIITNKTNYIFPSTKLVGKSSDDFYDDLYFGEDIIITKEGEIITKNIPIDQLAFDWNEYAKTQAGGTHGQKLHFYRKSDVILRKLSQIVFVFGFIFSIYAILNSPSIYNAVILGLYVVMAIIQSFTPFLHAKGSVSSQATGEALPFSVVRLISSVTNREVTHKVADRIGNYYGLVQNGTYTIAIDTKKDEQSYDKHLLSDPVTVKKGYLKEKFKV
jgi:hypothetical protein